MHKGSKGFELTLLVKQQIVEGYGGPAKFTSFAGVLCRHTGHATESDTYFPGHPLKFSWGGKSTKPLQFAGVKGTFGGGRGSIELTFHATGPARHVQGCRGRVRRRAGILSGSFTLHADKLGTITQTSFKATISTPAYTCGKPPRGYGVQTAGHRPAWVGVFKPSSTGPVSETIGVWRDGGFVLNTYAISGLPSSDYTLATSTLSTGHVTGGGGISGTATYKPTHSSTKLTIGSMTGSLAVTFTSIGKVTAFPSSRVAFSYAGSKRRF